MEDVKYICVMTWYEIKKYRKWFIFPKKERVLKNKFILGENKRLEIDQPIRVFKQMYPDLKYAVYEISKRLE